MRTAVLSAPCYRGSRFARFDFLVVLRVGFMIRRLVT
jgi:hypothetical protein